ncbi:condensation protein, partial [Streptomyces sp. NPDC057540]
AERALRAISPRSRPPAAPPPPGGPPRPGLDVVRGPAQVLPTRVLTFVHETAPLLRIGTWVDPALFAPDEAEGFLTGLVRLLEAAATENVPLSALTEVTGVRPVERGAGWSRVDGSWVSTAEVAEVLSGALGGVPAHVVEGASEGEGLTAFLACGDSPLTPEEAHTALMEALPGRPGVLAPRRYVIVRDAPAEADPAGAWLRQPILREGAGRDRHR